MIFHNIYKGMITIHKQNTLNHTLTDVILSDHT